MPGKYNYYSITPNRIRNMSIQELNTLCEFIKVKAVDASIVADLIRDRNEFKIMYFKLFNQLQDMGVQPVVNYYKTDKKGRPKNV